MNKIQIRMMRLPHAADLPLPAYQSELAAGLDLIAAVPADAPVIIAPGERALAGKFTLEFARSDRLSNLLAEALELVAHAGLPDRV